MMYYIKMVIVWTILSPLLPAFFLLWLIALCPKGYWPWVLTLQFTEGVGK